MSATQETEARQAADISFAIWIVEQPASLSAVERGLVEAWFTRGFVDRFLDRPVDQISDEDYPQGLAYDAYMAGRVTANQDEAGEEAYREAFADWRDKQPISFSANEWVVVGGASHAGYMDRLHGMASPRETFEPMVPELQGLEKLERAAYGVGWDLYDPAKA